MPNRQNALNCWLNKVLKSGTFTLTPLAGDASFRRYFRLYHGDRTLVLMDAPPEKESLESFLAVAKLLKRSGVRVPRIHDLDKNQGFVILEDFGDTLLLNKLTVDSAADFYLEAMKTIINLQQILPIETIKLPEFNQEFINGELNLFKEWFLKSYLKLQLSLNEELLIQESFAWLSDQILQQPQVFIHRDYHSRNIMLLNQEDKIELGIIDFQDAMRGPFTYDLVSLLKDCYIQWPEERVRGWLTQFYHQAAIEKHCNLETFLPAVDFCGLQRHLKVLGIFSRLYLRDNKTGYLNDLPLTLHYVMSCLERYEELEDLHQFMQKRVQLP